jgi:hypothetical protein
MGFIDRAGAANGDHAAWNKTGDCHAGLQLSDIGKSVRAGLPTLPPIGQGRTQLGI